METTKSEILLAVVVGLIAGIIATLGVTGKFKGISLPFSFKKTPVITLTSPISTPKSTPSITSEKSFLTITSTNEYYATSSAIVRGKSVKNSSVLVSDETQDKVALIGNSGEFSIPVALLMGSNHISVRTLGGTDAVTKELTWYYFP